MSLPPDTLWYNGDWNLYVGIQDVDGVCPCGVIEGTTEPSSEICVSRPPNQLNDPKLLMGTFTDFDVIDRGGWRLNGLFSDNFTYIDETDLTTLEASYEVRKEVSAYNGGTLVASGTSTFILTPTGRSVEVDDVLYTEYRFLITGLDIHLDMGKYWMNVAPIITPSIIAGYGSDFLMFNSTTIGTNSVGVPAGNNANDFFVVGTPTGTPTSYFIPSSDFGPEYKDFSNGVTGIILPICIDPDMIAQLYDGSAKMIRNLEPGDLLRTDHPEIPAKVVINYRNKEPHRVLVKIDPNAISPGVPNKTLLITTNHKIVVDGVYKKPRDLINGLSISRRRRPQPVNTHTIVTEKGEPVYVHNLLVSTWSLQDWGTQKP